MSRAESENRPRWTGRPVMPQSRLLPRRSTTRSSRPFVPVVDCAGATTPQLQTPECRIEDSLQSTSRNWFGAGEKWPTQDRRSPVQVEPSFSSQLLSLQNDTKRLAGLGKAKESVIPLVADPVELS